MGGRFAHRQTEQFARFVHAIESSPTEDLPPPPIAEARLTLSISRLASPPVANLATVLGSWGRFSAAEIWGALDLDCQGVSPRSFSRHCRRARGARLIRQFTLEDLARMVATWLRFEGGEPFLTAVLARVRDLAGIEQPKDVVKQ